MLFPIKFNYNFLPKFLHRLLPISMDIRELITNQSMDRESFSEYMFFISNGNIAKTTKPNRHRTSNDIILKEINSLENPVIIDIGASDGSTSLDLIEKLNFNFFKYYITDINFSIYYSQINKNFYFYDPLSKNCVFIVNDKFVIYRDINAKVFPFNYIASRYILKAPKFSIESVRELNLCQPELLKMAKLHHNILIKEWDVFVEWKYESADIVKAANILNRYFFTDDILIKALKNIKNILKEGGKFLIVENREKEKWSLFILENSKFIEINKGNEGTEIQDLIIKI